MKCYTMLLGLLACCAAPPAEHHEWRGRLYMHTSAEFSVLVPQEVGYSLVTRRGMYVRVLVDSSGPRIEGWCRQSYSHCDSLRVHVRSLDHIEGAGWDRGKFGQGRTVPFP